MSLTGLPVEMLENIATFLPSDEDLANFMRSCTEVNFALLSGRSGIWRSRFADTYDLPSGMFPSMVFTTYITRQKKIREADFTFHIGFNCKEMAMARMMRELINETFIAPSPLQGVLDAPLSNNLVRLREITRKTGLLENVLRYAKNPGMTDTLIQTLQLVFSHWALDLSMNPQTYSYPYSQQMVYSHPEACSLFGGLHNGKVNIHYALHIVNFFKYHMTHVDEQTLFLNYSALSDDQKPKAWDKPLKQGVVEQLEPHWKGAYAYLPNQNDVSKLRALPVGRQIIMDTFDHESPESDGFQTLDLTFPSPKSAPIWPDTFEQYLKAIPTPELLNLVSKDYYHPYQSVGIKVRNTKNQPPVTPPTSPPRAGAPAQAGSLNTLPLPKSGKNYLPFTGKGHDANNFHCAGIVHALPFQNGVIGWQRVTLMKRFDADDVPVVTTSVKVKTKADNQNDSTSSATSSDDESNPFDISTTTLNSSTTSLESLDEIVTKAVDEHLDLETWDLSKDCWAYEGVVLPGGKIMVGRWFSPADTIVEAENAHLYGDNKKELQICERTCTGPFIFWNVDA